jgi:hypothetical protein
MKKIWGKILSYLRQKLSRNKGLILVALCILAAFFLVPSLGEKNARLEVELTGEPNSIFQVFWAGKDRVGRNQSYAEQRSRAFRICKNKIDYSLNIPDLKSIARLRIDPVKNPSKVIIKRISITQMGYKPIHYETIQDFKRLIPQHDIKEIKYHHHGLEIIPSGIDPQMEAPIHPKFSYVSYSQEFISQMLRIVGQRFELLGLELVPVIYLLIDFLILLSISASFLVRIGYKFENAAETLLATGIVFLSCIVLSTIMLGTFYLLTWKNILYLHILLWLLCHLCSFRGNIHQRIYRTIENLRLLLSTLFNPIKVVFQRNGWEKNHILESLLIITIFFLLILYFIPAVFTLPLNYDANDYRLSRIGYWLQEMNIFHFATNDKRQLYMPINADLVMLWITSFFHRGYPLVHVVQFFGGLLCCAATYAIGRIVGFSRFWGLAAVLFFLGIPNAACQLFTSQIDLFTTGCLVGGLFFMYKSFTHREVINFALFGAGLGLSLGAKPTVFFWGPGLLFLFLSQVAMHRRLSKPFFKGIGITIILIFVLGGFNYFQNLISYDNLFGPSKQVSSLQGKNPVHKYEQGKPSLKTSEFISLKCSAYLWQIFEPSSNLYVIHPVTNSILNLLENNIEQKMEGLKSPFVGMFRRANRWVRAVKLNEDYMSFGFLPFLLAFVGGLTGVLVIIRSKRMIGRQITFIFFAVLLYFIFFCYIAGWTVHRYRYAVLLSPFLSILSIYFFQHFHSHNVRGKNLFLISVTGIILLYQAYMSYFISMNSLNHGWKAVLDLDKVPNYHFYWKDVDSLLEHFNDRAYRMGLFISKGTWSAQYFRNNPKHHCYYISSDKSISIGEDYFPDNCLDVVISQNLSSVKLCGDFNIYHSYRGTVVGIVPGIFEDELHPWIVEKDIWRDGWCKITGSLPIGNWKKSYFELFLCNPTPIQRSVVLSTGKDARELILQPHQTDYQRVKLQVNPNDTITWKVTPTFKPWKYANTKETRCLGVKFKIPKFK